MRNIDRNKQEITILVEIDINIEDLLEIKRFCEFYSDIVMKTEPAVDSFSFYLSEKEKKITLVERYKDSKAVMNHGINISPGGILETHFNEFLRLLSFKSIRVLGSASEELIKFLEELEFDFDQRIRIGG